MPCAPMRILSNSQNLIRTAILAASSVKPAENTVIPIAAARTGSGSVALTGAYTGDEDATLDVEIVDTNVVTKLPSAPVFNGVGSGVMSGITASGFAAQTVTVELKDLGIPILYAKLSFEGVKLVAKDPGADGNNIRVHIDQSPLTFTAQAFALLNDLKAGDGGPTGGLTGAAFEWDTAVMGEDGVIPTGAHRVSFGDDTSAIYLAYKQYVDSDWRYHFVPALVRDVPRGTMVKFVTGGRDVTITDYTVSPATVEDYPGIATVYDLLHAIRENSDLVTVEGIVANDRTPTGQASRELTARTDAHVEPSYGRGSIYATGFSAAFATTLAATELITAHCYAATLKDHPLAHLGAERWEVRSSLRGKLADAVTGIAYVSTTFGFLIPVKLPAGYGAQHGSYSVMSITYMVRNENEAPAPPICPVLAPLGPAAVDQTITLTYTRRPSGDCGCAGMPKPSFSGTCLGTESEGDSMAYSAEARTRLEALYSFASTVSGAVTKYITGKARDGIPETYITPVDSDAAESSTDRLGGTVSDSGPISGIDQPIDQTLVDTVFADFGLPADFQSLIDSYEGTIQELDTLDEGADKTAGWGKWDVALQTLSDDLDLGSPPSGRFNDVATEKYRIMLRTALAFAGISPMGKSDASILESGDGCWRDRGDAMYWTVIGSEGGEYAPAFNNTPYYSSKRALLDGKYYATKEFGFQLNIKCTGNLKAGDQIVLAIGDSSWPATYQAGDELVLPVIAGADLRLAGGQDGNNTQLWNVTGSEDGPLPVYSLNTDTPVAYSSGGLGFLITPGAIDYALGDKYTFALEGGHFKWRVNAGSWNISSPLDPIPVGPVLLYEGLSATFTTGNASSFAVGDRYSFKLLQPRAASNLQTPGIEAWQCDGDDQSFVFDFSTAQTFDQLAIALHTIPAGATITVEAGTTAGVYPNSTTLTRREGAIYKQLDAAWTARYVRLTLNDAPDAMIGWLYVGNAVTTTLDADLQLSKAWKINRGDGGLFGGGRTIGKTANGSVTFTEGALTEADCDDLQAAFEWSKDRGDEPLLLVPNPTRPDKSFLGRLASDGIEWTGHLGNAGTDRRFGARFDVAGVYQ